MKTLAIMFSSIGFALSLTVLVNPLGRARDRLIARLIPESKIIEWSLWDACDGEPMNVWAEELVRRDEVAERRRIAKLSSGAQGRGQ